MFSHAELERARRLLCRLQDSIRDAFIRARARSSHGFARIATVTAADTIYHVDKVSEAAILTWFKKNWPASWPVELIAEGLEGQTVTFPAKTNVSDTRWKCIIDPIDGTRGLMYDKRSAWSLAALAPQRGPTTNLTDIVVAAMTELPTSKQWRSDQVSAVKGRGPRGVKSSWIDVRTGRRGTLRLQPSRAKNFQHAFAALARFFPEGKAFIAEIEEVLWSRVHAGVAKTSPVIFDDQYISTGGQLYEVLAGHDRFVGDIRPEAFAALRLKAGLVCHPYDICVALIALELGVIVESPFGGPVRAPLDTTSPVSWVAYANSTLAKKLRPHLRNVLRDHLKT